MMSKTLAYQKGWCADRLQGLANGRTIGDTYLLIPLSARNFLDTLRQSDIAS
jgi:hypothetical protein